MSGGREVRAIGYAGWRRTLGAGIISLAYFFPVFYIITTAFKTRTDALAMPIKFLFTPTFQNFYSVFERADIQGGGTTNSGFSLYFFNSLFIGGTSVFLALVIGTAAAYGFSRFPLKGNETYLFIILTTRMLPPIIAIIPIFVLFRTIETFKIFDIVYLLTEGGPGSSTETVSVYVYRLAFQFFRTSQASALGYIMVFAVIVLTSIYLYAIQSRRSEP